MIRAKTESSADVIGWVETEAAGLWPAMLGSLSFRRSRCGHANCAACLSGEQHPSHVLYGRHNGRRFAAPIMGTGGTKPPRLTTSPIAILPGDSESMLKTARTVLGKFTQTQLRPSSSA
jgi:hypothetical protein